MTLENNYLVKKNVEKRAWPQKEYFQFEIGRGQSECYRAVAYPGRGESAMLHLCPEKVNHGHQRKYETLGWLLCENISGQT